MIGERIVRLTKDSIVYGLGSALTSVIGIALVPFLTRIFSPAEYGVIDLLVSIVFLSNVVFSFGFDTAAALLFFETDNDDERKKVMFTATMFVTGTAAVVTLVMIPFSAPLSLLLFRSTAYATAVGYMLATIPFLLLIGFGLATLRFHFARTRYLVSVLMNVCTTIGLTFFILLAFSLGVSGYFLAWLVTVVLTGFVTIWLARTHYRRAFSGATLRTLLRLGLPLVPAGLAGWSLSLIDRLFLVNVSSEMLGWYSLGVKISSILGLVVAAIQLAWGPFALSLVRHPEAKRVYAKVLTLFTAAIGFGAVLLAAYAPEITRVVSDPAFAPAARVVGYLSLGLVAYGSYYIVSIGVSVAKKTAHISWTTTIAAVANIILNFLLIPRWGMLGAAIATLISYVLSSWLLLRIGQRYYPIPYELRKVGTTWLLLLVTVTAFQLLPIGPSAGVFFIKTLVIAGLLLCLPLFRIIERNEIVAIRSGTQALLQKLTPR